MPGPGGIFVMRDLGTPIWHSSLAQAVDSLSSSTFGVSSLTLMENAAMAVVLRLKELPDLKSRTVVVLAGSGNNGGDGLAIARLLHLEGIKSEIFITSDATRDLSKECLTQLELSRQAGLPVQLWKSGSLTRWQDKPVLVVDAVFGLGFRGPMRSGAGRSMLEEAKTLTKYFVVAVDLPSGMDADSGADTVAVAGESTPVLPADMTVTFGALKPLHALAPARDFCGKVFCTDIGFPAGAVAKALEEIPPYFIIADDQKLLTSSLFNPWSHLKPSANKFDRGHILVLGGSSGKTGAPYLAGLAALRSGAGWVSLSIPEEANGSPSFAPPPEITYETFWNGKRLDPRKIEAFLSGRNVKAVVIGPGCMDQPFDEDLAALLAHFTENGGGVVIDAGATKGILPFLQRHHWVADRVLCTPHPGEWNRLSGFPESLSDEKTKSRETLVAPISCGGLDLLEPALANVSATMVYKGATPVVVNGKGNCKPALVCGGGSKILARAGTGDVVAGVAAAHLAMGMPAAMAFARSYALVARTAHLVAGKLGENAVLATDIIQSLGVKY